MGMRLSSTTKSHKRAENNKDHSRKFFQNVGVDVIVLHREYRYVITFYGSRIYLRQFKFIQY
jgi:hypothetical protein